MNLHLEPGPDLSEPLMKTYDLCLMQVKYLIKKP